MRANHHVGRAFLHVTTAMLLASLVSASASSSQAALTLGHQMLLERGLQIETLCMPNRITSDGGTFDLDLYKKLGFTAMNLWQDSTYDFFANNGTLPSGSNALPFSKLVSSSSEGVGSATYLPNLVRIQFGDEQPLEASALPKMATEVAALKAKCPKTVVYMNQHACGANNVILTSSMLSEYVLTVKPDMLSFTEYPYYVQGTGINHTGGSPTNMYKHIEMFRKAGLAGLTGDGTQPIPVSMFVQTFAYKTTTIDNHQPTESEFRLQQFAGWAAGMKMVDAFLYMNLPEGKGSVLDSMFFSGTASGSQTPTTQLYQYAELNRQSKNLGDALVRLLSTNFFIKMGQYRNGATTHTNATPEGVTAWTPSVGTATDPYLTGMTVTNAGTCNSGLAGDVVVGYLKPLDALLVAAGSENDKYFMIVNGLSDGTGTAADCRQQIHLTFDFGSSGITNVLRLSRETGLVEEVGLTHIGGSLYSLDLTLDGGTGDLFKYNTETAFIGTAPVPEPSGDRLANHRHVRTVGLRLREAKIDQSVVAYCFRRCSPRLEGCIR